MLLYEKMSDPLYRKIARVLIDEPWSSPWQAVDVLQEHFGGSKRVWWCGKQEAMVGGPAGTTMCTGGKRKSSGEVRHKSETHGCGWYFLYRDSEIK